MKIKRSEDKKKKELTEEEKELRDLKRAKNIGLAAMGIGGAGWALGRIGGRAISKNSDGQDKYPSMNKDGIKSAKRILNVVGPSSIIAGAGLHGISAVKYRKLKKKLDAQKKEEEDKGDDNSKKEK